MWCFTLSHIYKRFHLKVRNYLIVLYIHTFFTQMYFKTSLSYTGPKKYILRSAGTDSVWGFYSTEEKKKKKSRPIQMSLLI